MSFNAYELTTDLGHDVMKPLPCGGQRTWAALLAAGTVPRSGRFGLERPAAGESQSTLSDAAQLVRRSR